MELTREDFIEEKLDLSHPSQLPMTSACEIYKDMLMRPSVPTVQRVGGVFGMSTSGNLVGMPGGKHENYAKATDDLLRAKGACDLGLFLSPLSNKNTLFYTTPDNFNTQLEEARQKAEKDGKWYFPGSPFTR